MSSSAGSTWDQFENNGQQRLIRMIPSRMMAAPIDTLMRALWPTRDRAEIVKELTDADRASFESRVAKIEKSHARSLTQELGRAS